MTNARARKAAHLLAALLVLALGPARWSGAQPQQEAVDSPPSTAADTPSELLLIPAWPGSRVVQLRFESEVIPDAALQDSGAVTTVRSGLRLRAAAPVTDRLTLQAVARYSATLFSFEGRQLFFGANRPPASNPFDDLHDTRLSLQSAFELNTDGHLFFAGERWALIAELFGGARWEHGAFGEGLLGGGGLALGYEFPGRLRVALGVALQTRIAESGVGVNPVFNVRWRATDHLTLRTRGRGGQIEYEWSPRLTTYAAAFKTGSSWRLDRRRGIPSSSVLNDQQLRCGLGLEWRPHRQLRLNLEIGTVVNRELEVDVRGARSLSSIDGSPSAYLVFSLGLRP